MPHDPLSRLQWLVFALVGAVFTTVYIPQPVLLLLGQQFDVGAGAASWAVSAAVLGMALALALVCAGFFTIHASAAGALNRKVSLGRGRANAFYVLFYYLGGALGITLSGHAYHLADWHGVVALVAAALLVPMSTGLMEIQAERRAAGSGLG